MSDSSHDQDERGSTRPRRVSASSHASLPLSSGSRASIPPSEPRASRGSLAPLDPGADRPARLQLVVALLLGVVLVAIPLYLWRRPRAHAVPVGALGEAEPRSVVLAPPSPPEKTVTLSDPRNLLCQDLGIKKTAPSQCDHLSVVEKAFATAIEESADCLPKDAGGGTIRYVANISFKRKSIDVAPSKEGSTVKKAAALAVCQSAVRSRLRALSLDSVAHAHARYKIEITATYVGSTK